MMQTFSLTKDSVRRLAIWRYIASVPLLLSWPVARLFERWLELLEHGEVQSDAIWVESALWLVGLLLGGWVFIFLKTEQLLQMRIEMAENHIAQCEGQRVTRIASTEIAVARRVDEGLKIEHIDRVQSILVPRQLVGFGDIESRVGQWVTVEPNREHTLLNIGLAALFLLNCILAAHYESAIWAAVTVIVWVAVLIFVNRVKLQEEIGYYVSRQVSWKSTGIGLLFPLFVIALLAASVSFGIGIFMLALKIFGEP